ncbi:lytic transglycosylase domain-containing protein [Spirosoma sp. SC4-14]|uniref:lytic transglycosylase domain-containing protein n=1 Tax=Spirosoma sp. SC4-14 TaxID=3128900 RepID=UPI0030CFE13F
MKKLFLLVAAGVGCFFCSCREAYAQPGALLTVNAALSGSRLMLPDDDKDNLIHFCGENLPDNQPKITERWIRTLSRQASLAGSLALLKRRASVIFPLIEPILKQYNIPSDFKFLPLLESAVTNRAVSRRGAAGFWQLMPQTAQSLGLTVSRKRDDRFNLLKATHAACRYLNDLYQQLGSWMLVATAYNAGPNYIQQLSRQHPDLHPMALPYRSAETKAYLYQAVAVKELLTRPEAYRDYLSSRHLELLAESVVLPDERAAILASFDISEDAFEQATIQQLADDGPTFVTDSTTTVVLLTEEETTEPDSAVGSSEKTALASADIVPEAVLTPRVTTRNMTEGQLAEGKLYIFQVVQPITLNERSFAVGDMIHAHIEWIDKASGRVFLRTDRLITAETHQTIPLKLVATEKPKTPGVAMPMSLEGWKLTWEQL